MKDKPTDTTMNTSPIARFRKLDVDDNNEGTKWYVEFNRLLHSRRCINVYVFLIIFSVFIFGYSIAAYFYEMCKKK
jgi:hypothetical protein